MEMFLNCILFFDVFCMLRNPFYPTEVRAKYYVKALILYLIIQTLFDVIGTIGEANL